MPENSGGHDKPQNGYPSTHTYRRGGNNNRNHRSDDHKLNNASRQSNRPHRRPNHRFNPRRNRRYNHEREVPESNQATCLRKQIESNSHECMVCYDTINAYCATYSCSQCFNIFHLTCIRQWAQSKLEDQVDMQESAAHWTCPACQMPATDLPFRYLCYCKAVINPVFKPFILPHSCGEKCSRSRDCDHSCPEPCHPGKCPPCMFTVVKACHCGDHVKRVKCSERDTEFQCSKVCGRALNCGKHVCEALCHPSDCGRCVHSNNLACYCSKTKRDVSCGDENASENSGSIGFWRCGAVCGRRLACGNHKCPELCHPLQCPPCSSDTGAVRTCPCGKTDLRKILSTPRSSCLDPIPTCKKDCRKELPCGNETQKHFCTSQCHSGPCPPCQQKSLIMCTCRSMSEAMRCSDIPEGGLKCERVCFKKKSCGRHRCNSKCCTEDNHVCMIPCNKFLTCKLHRCEELCHKGHCLPCLRSTFTEVYCTCGKTKLDPPVACGTPRPKCNELCSRDHPCDHPVGHACHYEESCPPCAYLVNRMCMGGHQIRRHIPCHVTEPSCGDVCGKVLSCGLHQCRRGCHLGLCEVDGTCTAPCEQPRVSCGHACRQPCHPRDTPCNPGVCFEQVKVACRCKRRTISLLCFKSPTVEEGTNVPLARYMGKLRSMNISVSQQELHDYLTLSRVQCTEACRLEERNERLADAFGLKDVRLDSIIAPSYSQFLTSMNEKNKAFVLEVEEQFNKMITNYKAVNEKADTLNKIKHTYFDFKAMNRDKRRFIHELAEIYKIGTQSFDEEPQRNVQIKISYDSEIPPLLLSSIMPKKSNGAASSAVIRPLLQSPVYPSPLQLESNFQTLRLGEQVDNTVVYDSWEDYQTS